jgi:hypothetical protein
MPHRRFTKTTSDTNESLTGWCVTVQVFASNRNADYKVRERLAVLRNSRLQSNDLIIEVGLSGRRPHAEEKGSLGVDSSLDGADDSVGRAMLDHSVQACAGVLGIGVGQLLSSVEFVLEIGLLLGLIVVKIRAIVEALDTACTGSREDRRSGEKGGRETHVVGEIKS